MRIDRRRKFSRQRLVNTGNAIASRVTNITKWKISSPIANTLSALVSIAWAVQIWINIMKNIAPRHINEVESDRRCIKDGWYAASTTGKLGNGPFSTREDCLADIKRLHATIDA
jgi:hypothetical protein